MHYFSILVVRAIDNKEFTAKKIMSTEENTKDDTDLVEKPTETQTKPAKDRKNRKDKVKPMTKV